MGPRNRDGVLRPIFYFQSGTLGLGEHRVGL